MKITRSFSKKIQLRQYEPIEFFCAVEQEIDSDNVELREIISNGLDTFCQQEVEKSLNRFRRVDHAKAKDAARNIAELETVEEP